MEKGWVWFSRVEGLGGIKGGKRKKKKKKGGKGREWTEREKKIVQKETENS